MKKKSIQSSVLNHFTESFESLNLFYVIIIINVFTLLFNRKKIQLMKIKGQSDIEQQWLFHGTGKSKVENICLYNFDCRISESKRQGHVLGKG